MQRAAEGGHGPGPGPAAGARQGQRGPHHQGEGAGGGPHDRARPQGGRLARHPLRAAARGRPQVPAPAAHRPLGGGEADHQAAQLMRPDQGEETTSKHCCNVMV